jgi:hypothetical protein
MAVTRFDTANTLVNRAAARVGLTPVADVFAAEDPSFVQLTSLLTESLQTLMEMYAWNALRRSFSYTTTGSEVDGYVALPSDFGYMIDQTGWEQNNHLPLGGPLTAQEWTYLLGRDLAQSTLFVSIRFDQDQLQVFPQAPTPTGLVITFEYISRNLIRLDGTDPAEYADTVENASDIVLFPPNLIVLHLRMLFLTAKGFDSTAAAVEFNRAFGSWTGKDNGGSILNAGGRSIGVPLLTPYRNTPNTGYGGS